jgi:hypothetical protein
MLELISIINHSITITLFVFAMMLIVDYINVVSRGKIRGFIRGRKGFRQYVVSSFLGSTPGCLGAFMSVSFYVHGLISFGALTACMIATSGDEAFVMLTLFPKEAVLLFTLLFILGIFSGWLVDKLAICLNIKTCEECELQEIHHEDRWDCFRLENLKKIYRASKEKIVTLSAMIILFILAVLSIIGPKEFSIEKILLLSTLVFTVFITLISSEHYLKKHILGHLFKKHVWRVFLWTLFALIFV